MSTRDGNRICVAMAKFLFFLAMRDGSAYSHLHSPPSSAWPVLAPRAPYVVTLTSLTLALACGNWWQGRCLRRDKSKSGLILTSKAKIFHENVFRFKRGIFAFIPTRILLNGYKNQKMRTYVSFCCWLIFENYFKRSLCFLLA